MLGKPKEKKKILPREDAEAIIKEWGEAFELDTESKNFQDVIEELIQPVRHGKLKFNPDDKTFDIVLFFPIEKQDGSEPISMVKIRSTSMNEKKGVQKYNKKQTIDQATTLLAASCDIEIGFAGRIKEPDTPRINAVIMGFFVQAAPSRDSDD